jgi:F-type H+-transporting ATPase subunit b
MDQIVAIFNQLGVDATIAYQFAIFVVLFALLKTIFFDKLQFVLELREAKTTKLDGAADKKFNDADKMANEYEERMKLINSQAQHHVSEVKNAALVKQKEKIKSLESQLETHVEKERKEFMQEIEVRRGEVLKNADHLSDGLVQKLLQ